MEVQKNKFMNKNNLVYLVLFTFLITSFSLSAQVKEPDFIGNAFVLESENSYEDLDKEFGDFTSGISFSSNSWSAQSLEISGGEAQTRFSSEEPIKLVVRAADNNSDPLSIISIYKLKSKRKKRTVALSENNSGTLMKSRTHSKNMVNFNGKKYGESSYLLTLKGLEPGEYGVIVSNPNNRDEKRVIVSCFGINK